MKILAYVFDIDGVIANCDHRLFHIKGGEKNWKAFLDPKNVALDRRYLAMGRMMCLLLEDSPKNVIFLTGRSEALHGTTQEWLANTTGLPNKTHKLYMRKENDFRSAVETKALLMQDIERDGYVPMMIFEDTPEICQYWRDMGYPVCQVGNVPDAKFNADYIDNFV